MEIYPRSYFFIGLNETAEISEGVRQLCLGRINFSLGFFDRISKISAKSICSQLSSSHAPLQFIATNEFPTSTHFNWASGKIAQLFGDKKNTDFLYLVLFELKFVKNKQFMKLYDFFINGQYKEEITPTFMLNFYKHNRTLFISLIPYYRSLYTLFDQRELLEIIPKYDYAVLSQLDEEFSIIKLTMDAPDSNAKEQRIIVESVIESRNPSLQKNAQDLIATMNAETEEESLETIHLTIAGRQHFDDMTIQPLVNFLKTFQFNQAKIYAEDKPLHLILAYFICFPSFSMNKGFLEATINEIEKTDTHAIPIISQFIKCLKMDLKIFDFIFQLTGRKLSFEELGQHSIFFFLKDVLSSINSLKQFSFLNRLQSYAIENGNVDFSFISSYFAISCVLGDFNADYLKRCLTMIDDPLQLRWFIVDLFSLCSLKRKDGNYVLSINTVMHIIQLVNEFTDFDLLKKYSQHALNKAKCFPAGELTVEKLFEPTESLIHPLLINHQYEEAKAIIALSPKYAKFLELLECVEAYTQNLVCVPPLTFSENKPLFDIEVALSTGEEQFIRKAAKLESVASPILRRRTEGDKPLLPSTYYRALLLVDICKVYILQSY